MNHYLVSAKEQVASLDKIRYQKALDGSSQEFCHAFQLLTLFLHVNHPLVPGYVKHSPEGIAHFELSDYQHNYLIDLLSQHNLTINGLVLTKSIAATPAINGVYAMGSTGSITQNSQSDLDIWVCYDHVLSTEQLQKLTEKTELIQAWALTQDVEVNFYLLPEDHFRHISHNTKLTDEHCGSSQYMLLLDEFYRSVIRLAGKPLLWLHIQINNEEYYDKAVNKWIAEGKIIRDEWVDFGGLGALSANEYFGATLWHLFKGVDSPYKSVIKILLLESLMADYPYPQLISKQFKQQLLSGSSVTHHFDPYLAMLAQVTDYLTRIGDQDRLALVRSCFYLKANRDAQCYSAEKDWRYWQLQELSQSWGWSPQILEHLNQHCFWKVKQTRFFYQSLIDAFMLGYRNLILFARRQKISADLMPDDMGILTRKLYTAFEVLPEKITLFNRQIADNLTELDLMFVEVRGSKLSKNGWYLFNASPENVMFSSDRYREYAPQLSKLVAWAYFNGLLNHQTRLHIRSQSISLDKLYAFVHDLMASLAQQTTQPTNEDFSHPCELRNLFIAINFHQDPTEHLTAKDKKEVMTNLFNLSADERRLIGSIDFVYRNRWNEIRTLHFSGQHTILNCLRTLTHKVHRGSTPLDSINIHCYSQRFKDEILSTVEKMINKCIMIQVSLILNRRSVNRLNADNQKWNFSYKSKRSNPDKSMPSLALLGNNTHQVLNNTYQFPLEIGDFASEGFLQFFFEDNADNSFNVYILDEYNNPEVYYYCTDDKEEKIKEINHTYTMTRFNQKAQYESQHFNFPQFYQLIAQPNNEMKIVPYRSQQHLKNQT